MKSRAHAGPIWPRDRLELVHRSAFSATVSGIGRCAAQMSWVEAHQCRCVTICSRVHAGTNRRKPEETLAKKREELARVLERLLLPGLSARALRKHVAILEREIAELERV